MYYNRGYNCDNYLNIFYHNHMDTVGITILFILITIKKKTRVEKIK